MLDPAQARHHMVERHLARRGIADARVLKAMEAVPRETFVDEGFEEFAYEDSPLPIAEGQTISQPYIVARMAEAAEIDPADNVLEVGAGSGYAAAVLSHLAREVSAIERHAAERYDGQVTTGSYYNLRRRHACVDPAEINVPMVRNFNEDLRLEWALGYDLIGRKPTASSADVNRARLASPLISTKRYPRSSPVGSNGWQPTTSASSRSLAPRVESASRAAPECHTLPRSRVTFQVRRQGRPCLRILTR